MKQPMCEIVKCNHLYKDGNNIYRCNRIKNLGNYDLYISSSHGADFIEKCTTPGEAYYEKLKKECVHNREFQLILKLKNV